MPRQINLANEAGRDAIVAADGLERPLRVRWLDAAGRQARAERVLKATIDRDAESLAAKFGGPAGIAKALVEGDPEVDVETYGSLVTRTSRVWVDDRREIVHAVQEVEIVRTPDGNEKERRPRQTTVPNTGVEVPLKWSGRYVPIDDAVRRFVFVATQQVQHVNGLTFDFLHAMAKELEERDALLLVGAGPKAAQPLVLQRGGTPYRGFLEGRTRGEEYMLLLHLSNLELKA
jgi:hypothetical protein